MRGTNGQANGWKDGLMDGRTDGPSYRDSWTNLKREGEGEEGQCVVLTNVVGEDLVRGSGGGEEKKGRLEKKKKTDGWTVGRADPHLCVDASGQ